jgi:hypothetical protein
MSYSLKVKTGFITITTLVVASAALAALSRFEFRGSAPHKRNLATVMKMDRGLGKQMSGLTVQIVPPDQIPESEYDEVALTGFITLNNNFQSDLDYKWELPSGVTLVAGNLTGSLQGLKAGDSTQLEIRVKGFSREFNRHILLFGKVIHGQDELSHSALVASRPEDSLEYIAPQIREYAEQTRPEEFKSGRIVK